MNWVRLSVGEQMGAEDRERLSAGKRPAAGLASGDGEWRCECSCVPVSPAQALNELCEEKKQGLGRGDLLG
jgi:hypothetical protein